tara:strand:+ start:885 stop:1826 length:942 start_codon:yes stop_codon:yes gene_type:complete
MPITKFDTSDLNSVVEISLRVPNVTVSKKNDAMVKELLKHVPIHKRDEIKKLIHASSKFVPTAGTAIGDLRNLSAEFKRHATKKDLDKGYRGLSKIGRANGYIVKLDSFEHFESVVRSFEPRFERAVKRISDEWEILKDRGADALDVYGRGFKFPSLKKFMKRTEFGFDVESTLSDSAWVDTALAETASRIRRMAEKATERKMMEAHGRPVETLLDAVSGCIERLEAANGKTASGKKTRLRPEKFDGLKELVADVKARNFLNLPELETAANTVAGMVEGLDVVDLDPAERKETAKKWTETYENLSDRMSAAGL